MIPLIAGFLFLVFYIRHKWIEYKKRQWIWLLDNYAYNEDKNKDFISSCEIYSNYYLMILELNCLNFGHYIKNQDNYNDIMEYYKLEKF